MARWLSDYVEAWKSYDPEAIGALFSDDVKYRYHPYDDPVEGRGPWSSRGSGRETTRAPRSETRRAPTTPPIEPAAVDGEVAVATGSSTYTKEPGGPIDKIYDNCFVMRFDGDGRCREFTEWFMKRPDA